MKPAETPNSVPSTASHPADSVGKDACFQSAVVDPPPLSSKSDGPVISKSQADDINPSTSSNAEGLDQPSGGSDPLAAFLSAMKSAPDYRKEPPPPPKSSGVLLKHPEETPTVDPLLRGEHGDAIELNDCSVTWLKGEEEVVRILTLCSSKMKQSILAAATIDEDQMDYYELLKVPILASMDLIKKHYRKLSVLVHPDKCSHLGAKEAFNFVNTAYKELQKPQYRLRFKATLNDARVLLQREIAQINKSRSKGVEVAADWYSEDKLAEIVYSESDPRILNRLLELSESILKDRKERFEYAEKVRKANLMYEILQKEEALAKEYQADVELKQWKAKQEERVLGWRDFRDSAGRKRSRITTETVLDQTSKKYSSGAS